MQLSLLCLMACGQLLQPADLEYVGAFRVPTGGGASSFHNNGDPLAFNPANGSLFAGGKYTQKMVAEITIPQPVNSADLSQLNTATFLQTFADPTDGTIDQIVAGNGNRLGGVLVDGSRLLFACYDFYDASSSQVLWGGYSGTLDLSNPSDAAGLFRVGDFDADGTLDINPGYLAGYMTHIPPEHQAAFGGRVLAGQSGLSISNRTSQGPAAFVIDPDELGVVDPASAIPCLYYTVADGIVDDPLTANPVWTKISNVTGVVFPEGTDTVIYFGRHGLGDACYGTGAECNDPHNASKGWHDHGGNYISYAWLYDANDLLAVKAGTLQPWDVQPYAYFDLQLPTPTQDNMERIGGAAYDPASNRIYITQVFADPISQYDTYPIVHVYQLATPDPDPDPDPLEQRVADLEATVISLQSQIDVINAKQFEVVIPSQTVPVVEQ